MILKDALKLTEDEARERLEKIRWPMGPVCPAPGKTLPNSTIRLLAITRGKRACTSVGHAASSSP